MTSSYTFAVNIAKPEVFDDMLMKDRTLKGTYLGFDYTGTEATINFRAPLSDADSAHLGAFVSGYVDPPVYLRLHHSETSPATSTAVTSTTLVPVNTLIYTNTNLGGGSGIALDAVKTILSFTAEDGSALGDLTSASAQIAIDCKTRGIRLSTVTVDFTDVLEAWQAAGISGPQNFLRCAMFSGLIHKVSSYDCIWQYSLAVSDSRFSVSMNGLQNFYYVSVKHPPGNDG